MALISDKARYHNTSDKDLPKWHLQFGRANLKLSLQSPPDHSKITLRIKMPDWLNQEYIEKILRDRHRDDSITISDFKLSPVSLKGDNYLSDMVRITYRVPVNGQEKIISAVIKTLPKIPVIKAMVENLCCFETEILMLGDIIPAFHDILKDTGADMPLAAKLHFSEMTPNPILIMEDLAVRGFETMNRCDGLNLDQSLLVMKALATFHAASMVLLQKRPDLKKALNKGIWSSVRKEAMKATLIDGLNKVTDNIDSFSDEKWSEQLKSLQTRIPEEVHEAFDELNPNVPAVLCHGDAWINNIMFKDLGENKYDLRLVDHQLSSVRSPVTDLLYFIFTSTTNEIRISEINTMLKAYHQRWAEVCSLLGVSNDFTYEGLLEEFKKKIIFGFAMLYSIYAVIALPKEDDLEISKLAYELEVRLYGNKKVREALLSAMPYFKSQGLF